jgi:hypothetical protein
MYLKHFRISPRHFFPGFPLGSPRKSAWFAPGKQTQCRHGMWPARAWVRPGTTARAGLTNAFGAGIAGGVAAAVAGAGRAAPLIGWDILALAYGGWVWFTARSG